MAKRGVIKEEQRQVVLVGTEKIRDPRKEHQLNASPKKLARNLISGTWVFPADCTGAADIQLPSDFNAPDLDAKASAIDTTAYTGPVAVATLMPFGTLTRDNQILGCWAMVHQHPSTKLPTLRLQLYDVAGALSRRIEGNYPIVVQYMVDGR